MELHGRLVFRDLLLHLLLPWQEGVHELLQDADILPGLISIIINNVVILTREADILLVHLLEEGLLEVFEFFFVHVAILFFDPVVALRELAA